jgi:hypothetical protein
MKFLSFSKFIFIFSVIVLCCSCEKEGPAGANGVNGIDGVNGKDGNANVRSTSFSVLTGNWTSSGSIWYADLPVSTITADIANTGSVKVFMGSTTSTGVWLNMPWIELGSSFFSTFNFNYSTGSVRVFKMDSDLTLPSNPGNRSFKVIVVKSSVMAITNSSIDWTNYNSLKEVFNLAD